MTKISIFCIYYILNIQDYLCKNNLEYSLRTEISCSVNKFCLWNN